MNKKAINRAIRKYGVDNIILEVLEEHSIYSNLGTKVKGSSEIQTANLC